ncbi:MAG: hypothetical protein K9G49_06960 [Taibaiella sp.]|nr:hypothetical protein [Taibaiella sp.]
MTTAQIVNGNEPMQSNRQTASDTADSVQLGEVFQDRGFSNDEIKSEISKTERDGKLLVTSLFRLFQKTSSNIEIIPFSQRKG